MLNYVSILRMCSRSAWPSGLQLLSLALVAAAGFGVLQSVWVIQSRREFDAAAEVERLGGYVVWSWRLDKRIAEKQYPCYRPPSWVVPGDAFVEGVYLVNCRVPQLDQELACLRTFAGLRSLELGNAAITDAAVEHLADLSQLEWLDLHDTRISDASLPRLATMKRLKWICLSGTQVTHSGVLFLLQRLPATRIQFDSRPSS
jgi:hypothetical protein